MILPFSAIESRTIRDGCNIICTASKRRVRDAKLLDFITDNGAELSALHGLYFFFDPDDRTCLYVGKNSSLQFIERIPWHFAVSEGSWQNHFLKRYRTSTGLETLFAAAQSAGDCHVMLMPTPHEYIADAERLLRVRLAPRFNALSSGKFFRNLDRVPSESTFREAVLWMSRSSQTVATG